MFDICLHSVCVYFVCLWILIGWYHSQIWTPITAEDCWIWWREVPASSSATLRTTWRTRWRTPLPRLCIRLPRKWLLHSYLCFGKVLLCVEPQRPNSISVKITTVSEVEDQNATVATTRIYNTYSQNTTRNEAERTNNQCNATAEKQIYFSFKVSQFAKTTTGSKPSLLCFLKGFFWCKSLFFWYIFNHMDDNLDDVSWSFFVSILCIQQEFFVSKMPKPVVITQSIDAGSKKPYVKRYILQFWEV